MVKKVVTLYDQKASVYLQPMMFPSLGAALRDIADGTQGDGLIAKHPSDFQIFELGEWDDTSCKFELLDAKINHGTVQELLGKTQPREKPKAV